MGLDPFPSGPWGPQETPSGPCGIAESHTHPSLLLLNNSAFTQHFGDSAQPGAAGGCHDEGDLSSSQTPPTPGLTEMTHWSFEKGLARGKCPEGCSASAARWTRPAPLLPLRDIEYKELQLSLDQVSTSKSQDSWRTALSTSQEARKLAKPKSTKMKTKLRTNPYPPQVTHIPSCRGGVS